MVRSTCAQLDLRGRGCVGGGRAALRVDRSAHATNVDWSVCKRYTIFCAVQSSLVYGCLRLPSNCSRGPCEPNGYVQMSGHKGMRMESY